MLMSSRKSPRLGVEEITQRLKPIALPPLRENPLVSILTANYNYARFIGEAIESAQKQTYTNWEMIICDDGSTDNSCEVVERYMRRDPRIRMVTKLNGGQVSAANTAYCECKGQVVCFLDSDDRYVPEKLERAVQAFRSHPESGFVGHRMFRIDAVGRRLGVVVPDIHPPSGWYGPMLVRYGATPRGLACGGGQCLRREISDLIFPVSEGFSSGPDGAIMSLAPLMTPIIGIPAALTEVRNHGNNSDGHIRIASRRHSSESVDRSRLMCLVLRESASAGWEASRDYLRKVDPVLAEVLPSLAEFQGTLLSVYIHARLLETWGCAVSAYRDMVRAESFRTLPCATRWFWRLSVLLPRSVFRYALGPNRLKQLFWWTVEARRRLFALLRSLSHSRGMSSPAQPCSRSEFQRR
jgi:glycosyltransferase involved in cell wall biosynthesis